MPAGDTGVLVPFSDRVMTSCILDLYRSALPRPFATWGAELGPTSAPGLVLHAADDPFGDAVMSSEVAAGSVPARRHCPGWATGGRSRTPIGRPPYSTPSTPASTDRRSRPGRVSR